MEQRRGASGTWSSTRALLPRCPGQVTLSLSLSSLPLCQPLRHPRDLPLLQGNSAALLTWRAAAPWEAALPPLQNPSLGLAQLPSTAQDSSNLS